eukprot:7031626-Prymnesium_polylepis.1
MAELVAAWSVHAGTAEARKERAARLAKAKAGKTAERAVVESAPLPDELAELQQRGEDIKSLAALGKKDRGALKAQLKEMGFKGMRQRVKMEEALLAL